MELCGSWRVNRMATTVPLSAGVLTSNASLPMRFGLETRATYYLSLQDTSVLAAADSGFDHLTALFRNEHGEIGKPSLSAATRRHRLTRYMIRSSVRRTIGCCISSRSFFTIFS